MVAEGVEIGVEEHGYSFEFPVYCAGSLNSWWRMFNGPGLVHMYAGSFDCVRLAPNSAQDDSVKGRCDGKRMESKSLSREVEADPLEDRLWLHIWLRS